MGNGLDNYKVLGISSDASGEEIKRAFLRLAKLHHPDVSKVADAHTRFSQISEAYNVLSDPRRRAEYDFNRSKPLSGFPKSHSHNSDPLHEAIHKHERTRDRHRRSFFWRTASEWEDVKQHWEKQKEDCKATKERRARLHERMKNANAHRIAKNLAGQWPAQLGVTRQDTLIVTVFLASMSCISLYWFSSGAESANKCSTETYSS